jgi:GNAT superfamily N-acetyltransferase
MCAMTTIVQAASPEDISRARELFAEYARAVDEPACFEGFQQELADLPGEYAPPDGRLYLALEDGVATGCVALRRLDAATGEVKRLYLRAGARGAGSGRELACKVINAAREIGYSRLVLDTLPKMRAARSLYASLGFREIPPYLSRPTPGAICYELRL